MNQLSLKHFSRLSVENKARSCSRKTIHCWQNISYAMACQWSCCAKLFTQRHLLSTWFSFGDDIFRYVDRASKYCATEKKTTTSCCQTSGSKWFNFHHYLHLCAKRIPKADKLRTQLSVEQHKLNYDANSGISERHRRHRSVYNVTTKK